MIKDSVLLVGTVGGARHERVNPSEAYVEIPPARLITDATGAMWSFGTSYKFDRDGHYQFNVVRNDRDLDEYAQKIVYQRGKVRIFGNGQWRVWNGRAFI